MYNPLEIPEVRYHIGGYLCTKDLINCACVSKEWNPTFTNLIWRHLILTKKSLPALTVAQIQAHSSYIRALTLETLLPIEYYQLLKLTRLHSIQIDCQPFAASDQPLSDSAQIRCSPLKQMGIVLGRSTLAPHVIDAIGKCRRLKSLSLKNIAVVGNQFTTLLIACANVGRVAGREVGTNGVPKIRASGLIRLCLDRFNATGSAPIPFSTLGPLPCLEHLRIGAIFGMTSEAQLKLLMLCPNLRSLYWRRFMFEDHFRIDEWIDHIESGMWPLLTSLDVSGAEFHDEGLSRFIKSRLFPLEKLLVESTVFGPMAYNSIISAERHYNHIQELEIFKCTDVTSGMIQRLLTAMPALRYFSAGRLYVTDILDNPGVDCNGDGRSQGWICKNIRTLRLCIDMGQEFDPSCSEYAERQRQVYRWLSELTLLETLDVCRGINYRQRDKDPRRLDLRLSAGLEQLESLGRIRELLFFPCQSLTPRDVDWMAKTWKSLEVISQNMNRDEKINEDLMKILAKHDIKMMK